MTEGEINAVLTELKAEDPLFYQLVFDLCSFRIDTKAWEFVVMHPARIAGAIKTDKRRGILKTVVTRATGHLYRIEFQEV